MSDVKYLFIWQKDVTLPFLQCPSENSTSRMTRCIVNQSMPSEIFVKPFEALVRINNIYLLSPTV